MKKIIISSIIFLGAFFLTSCVTQRRCQEKFPPQVKDSSYTVETLTNCVDTVYTPGDSVSIPGDSIPCPELKYHREEKKGNIIATIDIKNGILKFDCKADSLISIINNQRKEITTNRSKTEVHTVVEFKTRWYDFVCRFFTAVFFSWIIFLLIRSKIPSK